MSDVQVRELIRKIFELIGKAKSIEDLIDIENLRPLRPYKVDVSTYPKLDFTITSAEVSTLRADGFIDADYEIVSNVMDRVTDPLTKFLYACLWKNGDLKKIKHIIKGVSGISGKSDVEMRDKAIVFHQFGRHLSGRAGEPIIDQHVLRSYAIRTESNIYNIKTWRKFSVVNEQHHSLIGNYKKWLHSDQIHSDLRKVSDYTYYIDRILFATGKSVKLSK